MEHFVLRQGGRLIVAHRIPGTDVASADGDYPVAAAWAANVDAVARTRASEAGPYVPPEERSVPRGFYADQGALF